MANREDEWIQILRKNIRLFNGKGWSIRGIKSGKLKKLQITHRIDDGLQHENPRESILTSIEFLQQNSPDIQTLIKDLHDLINPNLEFEFKELPQDDLKQRRPNIELAKHELNWGPKNELKEGLIKTIEWFKNNL